MCRLIPTRFIFRIRNQQVYTTLQHDQGVDHDKAQYEVLRLGKGNSYQVVNQDGYVNSNHYIIISTVYFSNFYKKYVTFLRSQHKNILPKSKFRRIDDFYFIIYKNSYLLILI
jgi:hypothetical protein